MRSSVRIFPDPNLCIFVEGFGPDGGVGSLEHLRGFFAPPSFCSHNCLHSYQPIRLHSFSPFISDTPLTAPSGHPLAPTPTLPFASANISTLTPLHPLLSCPAAPQAPQPVHSLPPPQPFLLPPAAFIPHHCCHPTLSPPLL